MPQGGSAGGDVVDGEVVLTSLWCRVLPASFSQWRLAILRGAEFGPVSQSLLDGVLLSGSLAERHMFARLPRSNLGSRSVGFATNTTSSKKSQLSTPHQLIRRVDLLVDSRLLQAVHNGGKSGPQTRLHWAHTILQCTASAAQPTKTARHSRHWTFWRTVHERELRL